MREQGALEQEEAYREASRIRDDGKRFAQEQEMAYISSGVEMVGTPLLMLAETESMAEAEALATEKQGRNRSYYANKSADITASEGRAQLISSILGAGSGLGKAYSDGAFTSKAKGGTW
jgi:hypothetical protein